MSADLFAGDFANLNFIGFSKDGKFLAFEEYGTTDGAGFPYSNIYFINVESNSYAAAPVNIRIEKESATEAQARSKAKFAAAKNLQSFKITAGNTGTHAVSHLLNDLSFYQESPGAIDTAHFAGIVASANYRKGDYELSLKPILTETKDCKVFERETYKMELTLRDNENKTTRVLQKDADLPKTRGCATDYAIQEVYLYENHIAAFLNVFSPGFEGDDMRFMVVSGKLN